jgi:hypothetical protein
MTQPYLPFLDSNLLLLLQIRMSYTFSPKIFRTPTPPPQLTRRRSGSPEHQWMHRAMHHAALIAQGANLWNDNFSNIIQLFRDSPS